MTPEMQEDFSEQRKAITSAISSGFVHVEVSASGIAALFVGVSIMLGLIAFTLMLNFFSSSDKVSVIRITTFCTDIAAKLGRTFHSAGGSNINYITFFLSD